MRRGRYAPKDLGPVGRRLWRSVHDKYDELTIGELLLLTEAARAADLCDALNTRVQQPRCPRTTMAELRAQRAALAALVEQLGI